MEKKAVIQVELGDEVQVFSESASDALDYEGAYTAEEARLAADKLLGGDFPRAELPYPDDAYGSPIYWCDEVAGRSCVSVRMKPHTEFVSTAAQGFFARYPTVAVALRAGAFGTVGRIVERSRKLAPFRPLLRYVVGERAFLAFALYWLGEPDGQKVTALEKLLMHGTPAQPGNNTPASQRPRFSEIFELARSSIAARDCPEFEKECREKLRALLQERKEPLVLSIVGTRFHTSVGQLASLVWSVQQEALRESILADDTRVTMSRIRDYVEGIQVLLVAEPYNPYDPDAVSALLRFPDGRTEHAGYVKREIASMLAPIIREGATFSGRVYKLYEGEADVQVRVG